MSYVIIKCTCADGLVVINKDEEDTVSVNANWLIDSDMVVYLNGKEVGVAGRVDGRVVVRLNRQVDLDVAIASGLNAFVESVTHTFQ